MVDLATILALNAPFTTYGCENVVLHRSVMHRLCRACAYRLRSLHPGCDCEKSTRILLSLPEHTELRQENYSLGYTLALRLSIVTTRSRESAPLP